MGPQYFCKGDYRMTMVIHVTDSSTGMECYLDLDSTQGAEVIKEYYGEDLYRKLIYMEEGAELSFTALLRRDP